jgi:hypothetical protein
MKLHYFFQSVVLIPKSYVSKYILVYLLDIIMGLRSKKQETVHDLGSKPDFGTNPCHRINSLFMGIIVNPSQFT